MVMIPAEHSDEIGVRPVVSGQEVTPILSEMEDIQVDMTSNWNQRYRENMLRIKSGNLLEVAKVVKGLMYRETQKGLSTGERKMLHSAKQILISELVLAQSMPYEAVEERVNKVLHQ